MKINTDLLINIGIVAVVSLILLMIIISIIKSRKEAKKGPSASILDVDIDGVDEDKTFEFGYEKEDTIVMEQVQEKPKKKTTTKKTTKKETKKK